MALDERTYDPGLRAGAQIQTVNIATGAVTGVKSSLGVTYAEIAINVSGTTAANVFGQAVAPTAGTITAFGLGSFGTGGTVVLYGTTAGTISTLYGSGTAGNYVGTSTLVNAAIAAGDTVTVTPLSGSMVCFINFQTAS